MTPVSRLVGGIAAVASLMAAPALVFAQGPAPTASPPASPLPFAEYLRAVERYSLEYAAAKQAVVIAGGATDDAGIRPDPSLSVGIASYELRRQENGNPPTGYGAGLGQTIELGGKRSSRVGAAEAGERQAQAQLVAFQHSLDRDAATAFAEAIRTREALKRKEDSFAALSRIVDANEKRFASGDIGRLELNKLKVEAEIAEADVINLRADYEATKAQLSVPLGRPYAAIFAAQEPSMKLDELPAPPTFEALVRTATTERDDVRIATTARDTARAQLDLAHANRWVDVDVNAGLTYTPAKDASPTSEVAAASVSVPIPFSRLHRGAVTQAEASAQQAEETLGATLNRVQVEVQAALARYSAALTRVRNYRERVLPRSAKVLEDSRISYQKGAASLLDLLDAQRTDDDTYLSYLDALVAYAQSKVELQLAAGQRPDLDGPLFVPTGRPGRQGDAR